MSTRSFSSVGEYEFILSVKTCSVSAKFPYSYFLTWKIANEVVASIEPQHQAPNLLTFNGQMTARVNVVVNDPNKTPYASKSSLCLNFSTPNQAKEPRVANTLQLNLGKFLDGAPEKEYSFGGSFDKKSLIRFKVGCKLLRIRDTQEVRQSSQLMRLIDEASAEKERSEGSAEPASLSSSIDKMLDRFFTPKGPKDRQTPEKRHSTPNQSPDLKQKQLIYETPKPRGDLKGLKQNIVPVQQNTGVKQEMDEVMTKLETQQRLRQALERQLEHSHRENEHLKSRTELLSQKLQEYQRKNKQAPQFTRKDSQTYRSILEQQNKQLKEELKEMKYAYEQESSISASLQRQFRHLNEQYEKERLSCASLQRQLQQLKTQHFSRQTSHTRTPQTSKSSTQRSTLKDQPKLERQLLKTQATLKEKEEYCNAVQQELEEMRRHMDEMKIQLANKSAASRLQARSRAYTEQSRDYTRADWEKRIHELEEELVEKDNRIVDLEAQLTPEEVLGEFNKKEEEIMQTFAVIQKECNKLIQAVRTKDRLHASVGIQTIDSDLRHVHFDFQNRDSPLSRINTRHDNDQSSHSMDEQQINRIRSQNESLKEQTKQLKQNLKDSRKTLWDFKEMVLRANEKPKTPIKKSERSVSRSRHHMRHIDRLKIEYTDKLRQMYNQIVLLNEVIYQNSAKEKEMAIEVQAISEKYIFMQKASRQMREQLQECKATHMVTIAAQLSTIANQNQQIQNLKDANAEQTQKISSLKVQMENMDNSDLLIVNDPREQDNHLELSRMQAENKELERRHGEMLAYIEQLRAQQQRAQERLILKEAEFEELKECKLSRRSSRKGKQNYQDIRTPIEEGPSLLQEDQSVIIAEALQDISDLLKIAFKGNQQIKEAKGTLKSVLEMKRGNAVELMEGRSERVKILEKVRQASIEFQRLKLDRLKSLEGSSELRKQFLKSIRVLQAKFDELLDFGQGVLNTKVTSYHAV